MQVDGAPIFIIRFQFSRVPYYYSLSSLLLLLSYWCIGYSLYNDYCLPVIFSFNGLVGISSFPLFFPSPSRLLWLVGTPWHRGPPVLLSHGTEAFLEVAAMASLCSHACAWAVFRSSPSAAAYLRCQESMSTSDVTAPSDVVVPDVALTEEPFLESPYTQLWRFTQLCVYLTDPASLRFLWIGCFSDTTPIWETFKHQIWAVNQCYTAEASDSDTDMLRSTWREG